MSTVISNSNVNSTATAAQVNPDSLFGVEKDMENIQSESASAVASAFNVFVGSTQYGSALGGVFDFSKTNYGVQEPAHYQEVTAPVQTRAFSQSKIDSYMATGNKEGVIAYMAALDKEIQRASLLKRLVEELSFLKDNKDNTVIYVYVPKILRDVIESGKYKSYIFGRRDIDETSYFQTEEVALWEQFVAVWKVLGDRIVLRAYEGLSDKAIARRTKYNGGQALAVTPAMEMRAGIYKSMQKKLTSIYYQEKALRRGTGLPVAEDSVNHYAQDFFA